MKTNETKTRVSVETTGHDAPREKRVAESVAYLLDRVEAHLRMATEMAILPYVALVSLLPGSRRSKRSYQILCSDERSVERLKSTAKRAKAAEKADKVLLLKPNGSWHDLVLSAFVGVLHFACGADENPLRSGRGYQKAFKRLGFSGNTSLPSAGECEGIINRIADELQAHFGDCPIPDLGLKALGKRKTPSVKPTVQIGAFTVQATSPDQATALVRFLLAQKVKAEIVARKVKAVEQKRSDKQTIAVPQRMTFVASESSLKS